MTSLSLSLSRAGLTGEPGLAAGAHDASLCSYRCGEPCLRKWDSVRKLRRSVAAWTVFGRACGVGDYCGRRVRRVVVGRIGVGYAVHRAGVLDRRGSRAGYSVPVGCRAGSGLTGAGW